MANIHSRNCLPFTFFLITIYLLLKLNFNSKSFSKKHLSIIYCNLNLITNKYFVVNFLGTIKEIVPVFFFFERVRNCSLFL